MRLREQGVARGVVSFLHVCAPVNVLLLNDTRVDPNPGCQATVTMLVRLVTSTLSARVVTRPRGDGYDCFGSLVTDGLARSSAHWEHALRRLEAHAPLVDAVAAADVVVANLEGTLHHHTVGALALGGAMALAHRMGKRVWAVNGTVEGIDPWLIDEALRPAEYVAVREPRSVAWLAAHGIAAVPAADAAFLADTFYVGNDACTPPREAALYTPGVLAGLSPSPATVVREVLADLEGLADAGREPVFLQMEEREAAVASAVARAGWPLAHAHDVAWHDFGTFLRQFALVVSGRYHVLLFAAMAGVPALALPSNTFKNEGLLNLLGRPGSLGAASRRRAQARVGPAAPGGGRGAHPLVPAAGAAERRSGRAGSSRVAAR